MFGEFFEDINEALREAVRQLGGYKKVGPAMRPDLGQDAAANWLRDSLNPDRREKLSPEQLVLLLRMASAGGFHGAMGFIAYSTQYDTPRPVAPEDQEAELQRNFVDAVEKLEQIQRQLTKAQQLRRVL